MPPPGGGPRERGHGAGGAAISLGALIGEKELREEPQPALRGGGGTGPACLAARPPPPEARPFPCLASGELRPPPLGKVRDVEERGSPAFPGDFFFLERDLRLLTSSVDG